MTIDHRSPAPSQNCFVARVPGSKSYTNRALVLAAQRVGTTEIVGGLHCDDTERLAHALSAFDGLDVVNTEAGFRVTRTADRLSAHGAELDMGAAGTPARFMLSFAAAAEGSAVVTGTPRLCARPMGDLLDTFATIGVRYECLGKPGCLPVRVHGSRPTGDEWTVGGETSSQFTSSLLLYAAQRDSGEVRIRITGNLVSRPYVEMTVAMMKQCGINVAWRARDCLTVTPSRPSAERIQVEVDASGMSYFLAAAAATRTAVTVPGIGGGSAQGDVGLARAFERMGCRVELGASSITVTGAPLTGIDIDMETMPDVVLTLAAVAPLADGATRIRNIHNLRLKECDRIHAAATELERLGVSVEEGRDFLVIQPGARLRPARIHTYDDHRVAMAFAVLGLCHEGVEIEEPDCVAKSFPGYWDELARLVRHHRDAGIALSTSKPLWRGAGL